MIIIQKSNFYILYYIFILIKSLFILFNIKKNLKYKNYIIYIILFYIKLYYNNYNIIDNKKNFNINYYIYNYIYFYIYKYNSYIVNCNIKNIFINKNNNIIEKIISIKKVSYTIKKGRIKRYKVILLIGNKKGWIGIGIGKNCNINNAIISAKINALNNIYYFKYSLLNLYKLKVIYINLNKLNLKLQFQIYNILNIKFLLIKYILECLGYLNCKIIIYHNILHNKYNFLYKLLLILFNVFK